MPFFRHMLTCAYMIHLEIDLTPSADIEQSITNAVNKTCGEELQTLQSHLHSEFRLMTLLGPSTLQGGTHLPAVLHRLTDEGQSKLGRMLTGESVTMNVRGSTVCVERNSVLCNVLSLLVPLLSVDVLADLMSAWALTDSKAMFQKALCEYYYLQTSACGLHTEEAEEEKPEPCEMLGHARNARNAMSGEILHGEICFPERLGRWPETLCELGEGPSCPTVVSQCPSVLTSEQRALHFLRTLFCMLTVNRRKFCWFGQCARGHEHRSDHPLTKKFGLSPPDFDRLTDPETLLDVAFAVWYLSISAEEDIADAFETVGKAFVRVSLDEGSLTRLVITKSTFVRVLMRSSFDILNAVAPNCLGCDSLSDVHCGGGCGTKELITCLTPLHAMQLLEMLVCSRVETRRSSNE